MEAEGTLRFSVDGSLGKLARQIRLLGHDAAWVRGDTLECSLSRARAEGRALLTRSAEFARLGLAMPIAGGKIIASSSRLAQLVEVGEQWPVFSRADPFTRCADCNEPLLPLDRAEARSRVPAFVAETQRAFQTCPLCQRVFWNGTHAARLLEMFAEAAQRCSQELPDLAMRRSAEPEVSDPALPNG